MRKIKTKDVFKLARIIRNSGAKDELTEVFGNPEEDTRERGLKAAMTLISAASSEETEKAIYDLIGDIAEKKPSEIENMELEELKEVLKAIADENNLSNFFDAAVESA